MLRNRLDRREDWEEDEVEEDDYEELEEEQDTYDLPKLLTINKSLVKRLNRAGYSSLWDIADAEVNELVESVGISSIIAKRIIEKANKCLEIDEGLEVEVENEEAW